MTNEPDEMAAMDRMDLAGAGADDELFLPRPGHGEHAARQTQDHEYAALHALAQLLSRYLAGGMIALDEATLRSSCSTAVLRADPDASGSTHEMDVRRLLNRVVDAYQRGGRRNTDNLQAGLTHFRVRVLHDTVCLLCRMRAR